MRPALNNHSSEPSRSQPDTGATSKSLACAASSTSPASSKLTLNEAAVPSGKSLSTLVNTPDPETVPLNVARIGTAAASCGTLHASAATSRGKLIFMCELLWTTRSQVECAPRMSATRDRGYPKMEWLL